MPSERPRVGVDIGGTFTDVALVRDGQLFSTKLLTTYAAPERAIIDGIIQVARLAGVALHEIGAVIHGTTLATNALIERRGARTAFITTSGFRDVLEMRTENRFELYDLNIVLPAALVPRKDRHVVRERIDAKGCVLRPLDDAEVHQLAALILQRGYESVAVGLLHSYVNPGHERRIRDILLQHQADLPVSLSSDVSPQMREFQRFNTVCANAYVKPLMASYLGRLADRLREAGTDCPVFMIHSGGGIITLETAAAFPVRLLESGPAGGAIFAAGIAARYGLDRVLSYDMGGTTAKICLIEDSVPKTAKTFEVARTYRFKKGSGMPISIPVIEMVEIGAGGGSIASVDRMGQIRVGPQSAGSEPGPACYGNGGTNPTVTDADLVLGRLDPDDFAGGTIALSRSAAEGALEADLARKLGIAPQEAAFGLCEVVDETMSGAARMHGVENGADLAGYTMVAFGGAAPLHASRICEKLGIVECLIPPGAGVGSAIGFLQAPVAFEAVRSVYIRPRAVRSGQGERCVGGTGGGGHAVRPRRRARGGDLDRMHHLRPLCRAGLGNPCPLRCPPLRHGRRARRDGPVRGCLPPVLRACHHRIGRRDRQLVAARERPRSAPRPESNASRRRRRRLPHPRAPCSIPVMADWCRLGSSDATRSAAARGSVARPSSSSGRPRPSYRRSSTRSCSRMAVCCCGPRPHGRAGPLHDPRRGSRTYASRSCGTD